MNPITVGHQLLVNSAKEFAHLHQADFQIFLSQTHNKNKNPLDYKTKVQLAQIAFGPFVYCNDNLKTLLDVLVHLNISYSNIVLYCGEDRYKEYTQILNKYNHKLYKFDNIEIKYLKRMGSFEQSISASEARNFALSDDFESFKKSIPVELHQDIHNLFNLIKINNKSN